MDELTAARINQSIDKIEEVFGPTPFFVPRPVNRVDLLRYILDNKLLLQKATYSELATITAIIESCKRRQSSR